MSVAARIVTNIRRGVISNATQSDSGGQRYTTAKDIAEALKARPTDSGADVTDTSAMSVAAVYACVRLLSESVAMLPHKVHRRLRGGGQEPASDHPLAQVLERRPNVWQTPFEFRRLSMVHMLLRGNAYAQITRVGPRIVSLTPLNPARMEVGQTATGELGYIYTKKDGKTVKFTQDDILHLRSLSTDGLVGISPIESARQAIGTALAAESHSGKLFGSGIQTTGVLKHPANLSPEAITRLADSFASRYSGSENAFRPLILEEGMDWQSIGMNSTDAQFIEGRKFQRNEIAMFYGVPPHMIGDIERGTSWGSGIEQQGLGFLTHTLMPWLVNIEQSTDAFLLGDEAKRFFTNFDTSEIVRVDFAARQAGYKIMRENGVLSANEWRKSEGMQPRSDAAGDEYVTANPSSNSFGNKGLDNAAQPAENQ